MTTRIAEILIAGLRAYENRVKSNGFRFLLKNKCSFFISVDQSGDQPSDQTKSAFLEGKRSRAIIPTRLWLEPSSKHHCHEHHQSFGWHLTTKFILPNRDRLTIVRLLWNVTAISGISIPRANNWHNEDDKTSNKKYFHPNQIESKEESGKAPPKGSQHRLPTRKV